MLRLVGVCSWQATSDRRAGGEAPGLIVVEILAIPAVASGFGFVAKSVDTFR